MIYDWLKRPLQDYAGEQPLDAGLLQHFREHCLYSREDLEWLLVRAGFVVRETVLRRGGNYALIVAERTGS